MSKTLIINDLHCGAIAGLTPPGQWSEELHYIQKPLYNFFKNAVQENGPYDALIVNGDSVDGEGKKDTIGQLTTNTLKQAKMAAQCIELIDVPRNKIYHTYGTPFHTSGTYDYEDAVCMELDIAKPKDIQRLILDGVRIRARHFIGRSGIPYGQGTPALKELVRDAIESMLCDDERADIIFGAHVHYRFEASLSSLGTVIIVPCLEMPESVFGRKCASQYYDLGVGILETNESSFQYKPILMNLQISKKREWVNVNGE